METSNWEPCGRKFEIQIGSSECITGLCTFWLSFYKPWLSSAVNSLHGWRNHSMKLCAWCHSGGQTKRAIMGPSGLRIYRAYQILQKVMAMKTRNMEIKYIIAVTLYIKWGFKTKHCKLEVIFYLLNHIYLYGRYKLNLSVDSITHQIGPNYRDYSIKILFF